MINEQQPEEVNQNDKQKQKLEETKNEQKPLPVNAIQSEDQQKGEGKDFTYFNFYFKNNRNKFLVQQVKMQKKVRVLIYYFEVMKNRDIAEYLNEAYQLYKQDKFEQSIMIYDKIIQLWPKIRVKMPIILNEKIQFSQENHYAAHLGKARVLIAQKEYDEALKIIEFVIQNDETYQLAYFMKAKLFYVKRQYPEALEIYDNLIKKKKKNPIAHVKRGNALIKMNQIDQAMKAFEQAILQDEKLLEAYYRQGLIFFNRQEFENALQKFETCIGFEPSSAPSNNMKGQILYEQKQYSKALECFEIALKKDPFDLELCLCKANCLYHLNKFDDAFIILKDIHQKNQRDEEATFKLANIYYMKKEFAQAENKYSLITEKNQNFEKARFNRANSLHFLHKNEEAINIYDEILQMNENHVEASYRKGCVLFAMQEYEKALKQFDDALEIDKKFEAKFSCEINLTKGILLSEYNNQFQKSLECFDLALQQDPNHVKANFHRGYALYTLEQYEEAIQAFNKTLEIDPLNGDAFLSKGKILMKMKRFRDAEKVYDEAIEKNPNLLLAFYNLGINKYHQQKFEESIAIFKQILNKWPHFTRAYDKIGTIMKEQNNLSQALEYHLKALEIDFEHFIKKISDKNNYIDIVTKFKENINTKFPNKQLQNQKANEIIENVLQVQENIKQKSTLVSHEDIISQVQQIGEMTLLFSLDNWFEEQKDTNIGKYALAYSTMHLKYFQKLGVLKEKKIKIQQKKSEKKSGKSNEQFEKQDIQKKSQNQEQIDENQKKKLKQSKVLISESMLKILTLIEKAIQDICNNLVAKKLPSEYQIINEILQKKLNQVELNNIITQLKYCGFLLAIYREELDNNFTSELLQNQEQNTCRQIIEDTINSIAKIAEEVNESNNEESILIYKELIGRQAVEDFILIELYFNLSKKQILESKDPFRTIAEDVIRQNLMSKIIREQKFVIEDAEIKSHCTCQVF